MALTKSEVLASLERVASPEGLALPQTGALSDVVVSDGKVFFSITVDAAAVNAWEPVRRRAEAAVKALPGAASVMVALTAERAAGRPRPGATSPAAAAAEQRAHGTVGVPGVEAIIAVASGKGGVGKSTVAVNLALSISRSACAISGSGSACSTPIFTGPRPPGCSPSRGGRRPRGARG